MPGFEDVDERVLGENGAEVVASIERIFDGQEMAVPFFLGSQ